MQTYWLETKAHTTSNAHIVITLITLIVIYRDHDYYIPLGVFEVAKNHNKSSSVTVLSIAEICI